MVRRIILIGTIITIGVGLFLVLLRSLPYSNSDELLSATISVDSTWSLGPATAIFDKHSHQYYWLKSYTSFDQSGFDTLKLKQARIKYMKFLEGPLENRVYQMEVYSIIVFDQVIEIDSIK